ncbi:hypothetical protein DXS23_24530 [Salmonella enterica subsp. enterica]|nr:hypothetical protein [Salmonella enterica subsp. enterica]
MSEVFMKLMDVVSNFIERIPRRLIWALGMFSVALIITFFKPDTPAPVSEQKTECRDISRHQGELPESCIENLKEK